MATLNTKRIEESATLALKGALLRCPTLSTYISENDKTPSWDGQVFVYASAEQKKTDGILAIPIQVKGTISKSSAKSTSYSCEISDLKIWMNNGGCMLFLVSLDFENQSHQIYYSALQVYDLKKELVIAYKEQLLKQYKITSANSMLAAVNSFLRFVALPGRM